MAADAARQRRHDRLALRRQPALASVAYHPRGQHQVLNLVRLITFELRTRRMRHPQHLGLGHDPQRHLAAAATFEPFAARLRLTPLLHAARLDGGTALQPLQPSDLIALPRHEPFQIRHLGQQFHHQSVQLGTWQTRRIGGRWHVMSESYSPEPGQTKNATLPRGSAPVTEYAANSLIRLRLDDFPEALRSRFEAVMDALTKHPAERE